MSRRKLHELNVRVGNSIAPTRFVLFVLLLAVTAFWWHLLRGSAWSDSVVTGFDLSAFAFIVSLWPLHNDHSAAQMRAHAAENDANRGWVLGITGLVSIAILAAISGELPAAHHGSVHAIVKLIG
ncbi:MAG: DUF1345 domain-containing protein, partial [Sphingomonadales bacterium]|nr:DUF1345 domain-containing protein [Sphingomonadales bacterium]